MENKNIEIYFFIFKYEKDVKKMYNKINTWIKSNSM